MSWSLFTGPKAGLDWAGLDLGLAMLPLTSSLNSPILGGLREKSPAPGLGVRNPEGLGWICLS